MAHPHHKTHSKGPKTPPSPYVQVTILFRDALKKPIEGLSVQVKAGTGAPSAPEWRIGMDDGEGPPAATPASAPDGASAPQAAPAPAVDNRTEAVTDRDGYAVTIQNAARNQPIDVLVRNRHGEYVLKATVTPTKDISAFTVCSPEFHIEATTKLTPKDALEQDLNVPVVKEGEVMTIERLVREFGPYIGSSQMVTEQGKVKKDFPEKHKETVTDEKTGKQKSRITIEHHYKVVDNGKPRTIVLNLLGSRLNYPKTLEISEEKYSEGAKKLGCEAAAIKAVALTESGGMGFCDNGLPKILYERQAFFRALLPDNKRNLPLSKIKGEPNPYPKYPNLCFPAQGGYTAGGVFDHGWSHGDTGVMHQYERFLQACTLNRDAAIQACSWGAFQVLAFFYKECGYPSAEAVANSTMQGIDEQFELFVAYVNMNKSAKNALQSKDWESFAFYYNGRDYPEKYPALMKEYYDKYK